MARSIIDIMKDDLRKREQVKPGPSTRGIAAAIRARGTGKSLDARGPEAESTQGRMAAFQGQQALDQVASQGAVAAQQVAGAEAAQEQQAEQARTTGNLQRSEVQQGLRLQENQILNNFEQGIKKLNSAGAVAELEDLGRALRLSNRKYIEDLQNLGMTKRLDNEQAFRIEAHKTAFRDAEDLLGIKLDYREIVNADDREFKKWLEEQSTQWNLEKIAKETEIANTKAAIGGGGTIASTAVSARKDEPPEPKGTN
jgi:hypothetical protein